MSHTDKPPVNLLVSLLVATLMLVMAISVLVVAFGFHGGSGLFPRFIGWIFVGLAGLEFLLQLKGFMHARKMGVTTMSHENPDAKANLFKEIKGLLWIVALLVGIYLIGFMITLPVYLFSFMRFSGRRSIQQSAIISVGSTAFVYVSFVVLLDYRLYPGILFGA